MSYEYKFSSKAAGDNTGIFARLTQKRDELLAAGRRVYNLYIGTPDFPTPEHIVRAVSEAAAKAENFKYALTDLPELGEALTAYYQKRYGVKLEKDEFTSVNGSQDGIGHLGLALCDPEDVVLLPDPGYPVFSAGVKLAGATIYYYKLRAENKFLPNLAEIPEGYDG